MKSCLVIFLAVFRAIFIPAQFSDRAFDASETELKEMVEAGADYFNRQFKSYKAFLFDCAPVVTLDGTEERYLSSPQAAVVEAFNRSDAGVDFSLYDAFILLCAGEAMPAHAFFLEDYGIRLTLDGRRINQYAMSTESRKTGALCHEMMHILGCPDFYDTDGEGSGGLSEGLGGSASLMDMGDESGGGESPPDLCAPELDATGLLPARILTAGTYNFPAGGYPRVFGRIDSDIEGRYYLLECAGAGKLTIYEVDKSLAPAGFSDKYRRELTAMERWALNEVNCRPDRPCVRFVSEVSGPLVIEAVAPGEEGGVVFNVREPLDISLLDVYQDGAIVNWVCEDGDEFCRCDLVTSAGKVVRSREVSRGAGGGFSATLEGLEPLTEYTLQISTARCRVSRRFVTKAYNPQVAPYIFLGSARRDSRGCFEAGARLPLRIYNAPDAGEIRWYFDSEPVNCGEDGYFVVERSGELRAEWGTQRIVKKITVK